MSHLTPREHAKVIGLVGKKCIVKCLLNDCEFELLWDTGAQVSIISLEAIQQHLGSIGIRQLSELLDTNLNLTEVNGTKIPYFGWVEVRLRLIPSSRDSNQEEMIVGVLQAVKSVTAANVKLSEERKATRVPVATNLLRRIKIREL